MANKKNDTIVTGPALRLILKSEDKGIRVKKQAYQPPEFQVYFPVESS